MSVTTSSEIEFLLTLANLSDSKRTGWVQRGIENPQRVLGHIGNVSILTMMYAEEAGVDPFHAIKIAQVHDLPESITGDIAEGKGRNIEIEEQIQKEEKAASKLSELSGNDIFVTLWREFENEESKEAEFVKDMDAIDMCLHALKYEIERRYGPSDIPKDQQGLEEFFQTAEEKISTATGERLYTVLQDEFEKVQEDNLKK